MEWENILMQVIQLMIVTFIPIIGLAIRKWIASKTLLNDLLAQETLVQAAVEFVEQAYSAMDGEQKYEQALVWLSQAFARRGFKFSSTDLRGMIEAAVYQMGQGWFDFEDDDYDEESFVAQG